MTESDKLAKRMAFLNCKLFTYLAQARNLISQAQFFRPIGYFSLWRQDAEKWMDQTENYEDEKEVET